MNRNCECLAMFLVLVFSTLVLMGCLDINETKKVPVKITSESCVGSGTLVYQEGGNEFVVTSKHSIGLPQTFDIEMPDGTMRKAMWMNDSVVLKLVPDHAGK